MAYHRGNDGVAVRNSPQIERNERPGEGEGGHITNRATDYTIKISNLKKGEEKKLKTKRERRRKCEV